MASSLALLLLLTTPVYAITSYFVDAPSAVELKSPKTLSGSKQFLQRVDIVTPISEEKKVIAGEPHLLVRKMNYNFEREYFSESDSFNMTLVKDQTEFEEQAGEYRKRLKSQRETLGEYAPDEIEPKLVEGYVPEKILRGFTQKTKLPDAVTNRLAVLGFRVFQPHDFRYLANHDSTAPSFYQPSHLPAYTDQFRASEAKKIPYLYEMKTKDKESPAAPWNYQPVVEFQKRGTKVFLLHLAKERPKNTRALALARPDGSVEILEETPEESFHHDLYFHLVPEKLPLLFDAETRRVLQENYNVDFSWFENTSARKLEEKNCRNGENDWRPCPPPPSREKLPALFKEYEAAYKKIDFLVYTHRGDTPSSACPVPSEDISCSRWILFFEGSSKPTFFPENCEGAKSFWSGEPVPTET